MLDAMKHHEKQNNDRPRHVETPLIVTSQKYI